MIVADVYPAGEAPIEGIDKAALIDGLRSHGHRTVVPLADAADLPELINDLARPGDMVVCLGAGSVSAWANDLPAALTRLRYGGGTTGDEEE